MSKEHQQREIIINSSEIPILRAGLSNIILFLLLISLIYTNQLLNEISLTLLPKIVIFLIIIIVTLKVYSNSISRLSVKDGNQLIIVGPISKTTIDTSKIVKTDISGIPSSMIILVMFKMKNATLPKCYFFVALSTSCGSYSDSKKELADLLKIQG